MTLQELCVKLRFDENFYEALSDESASRHLPFLESLLSDEVKRRDAKKVLSLIKRAGFSELYSLSIASLSDYDFSVISFPVGISREYVIDGHFIEDGKSLYFAGPPGVGKTHLATSVGLRECAKLNKVSFFKMPNLVHRLKNDGGKKIYSKVKRDKLIVIDDFGLMPTDGDSTLAFSEFFSSACYEQRKSVIFTSNLTFSEWLDLPFERLKAAHAVIDRVIGSSIPVQFSGKSYRVLRSLAYTARQAKQ